jgi:hypothetical protein
MIVDEDMLERLVEIYDQYDVGTPAFILAIKTEMPDLSGLEIGRIGWRAKTPEAFLRTCHDQTWWRDSESATISTVNSPAINPEGFASMYKGSREMREAGCDVRTTEEIFRRMLVVWCAQNDMPVDEDALSYDDLQAYNSHKKPAADVSETTEQPKCPVCGVPLSQEVKRCSFDGCPRMTTAYNPFTSPLDHPESVKAINEIAAIIEHKS